MLVTDLRGFSWVLDILPKTYSTSRKGLVEMKAFVLRSPLKEYNMIPIPVFTEWWPDSDGWQQ